MLSRRHFWVGMSGFVAVAGILLGCGSSSSGSTPPDPLPPLPAPVSPVRPYPVTPRSDPADWAGRADAVCSQILSAYHAAKKNVTDPLAQTVLSADLIQEAASQLSSEPAPTSDADELIGGLRDLSASYRQFAVAWDSGSTADQERADVSISRAADRVKQAATGLGTTACLAVPDDM